MTPATHEYDDLSERAERGGLTPVPGTSVRGEQAAQIGRDALLAATGANSFQDVINVAVGRPRLGERTETVTWRIRTPKGLDDLVREASSANGVTLSEYIRLAVSKQLEQDRPLVSQ